MIVEELYLDSICSEESSLAHYIHHLLAEQKISLKDDISKIDFDQADHEKVAEMIENNVLGFNKIGIYSLKMNDNDFVFIFASSEQQAVQYYFQVYHHSPLNCHEYSLDIEFVRGKGVVSFRDMRKEFTDFPAVVGYFTRGSEEYDINYIASSCG